MEKTNAEKIRGDIEEVNEEEKQKWLIESSEKETERRRGRDKTKSKLFESRWNKSDFEFYFFRFRAA